MRDDARLIVISVSELFEIGCCLLRCSYGKKNSTAFSFPRIPANGGDHGFASGGEEKLSTPG
jgi:hypothetical protein